MFEHFVVFRKSLQNLCVVFEQRSESPRISTVIRKTCAKNAEKQLKTWIRSQHLICVGTDFVFETVDQSHLDKFEQCIENLGGHIRTV